MMFKDAAASDRAAEDLSTDLQAAATDLLLVHLQRVAVGHIELREQPC